MDLFCRHTAEVGLNKERKKGLTYKNHHDPNQVDRQAPLFSIWVQKVEHDGRDNEENEAAHLQGKH